MEFSKGKFGRPIDGYEEMELAAIVERQERMLAESHSDGSSSTDKTVERGSFGPTGASWTKGPLLPLGDGLGIDI